jgi:hypothetical protein
MNRALSRGLFFFGVAAVATAILAGDGARSPASADEMPCPVPLTKSGVCGLHGKVKVVTAFPKYKVKIVDAFPDIKVQKVTAFPDGPGKWQLVDAFPDFTVQFVDAFPDFTVKYVDAFPGCD